MNWGMMHPRPGGVHMGGYPVGMIRMRAPFPRSMDPRQIEFERMHQQRLQMMRGNRPPPPHHMPRPPYMEVCHTFSQRLTIQNLRLFL